MLKIGLTGGIGCGKSTVASKLAELGVTIIDTDLIAHQLSLPKGKITLTLVESFGDFLIDNQGELKRNVLREFIIADNKNLAKIEEITHPLIRQAAEEKINVATGKYCVLVVPLLVETQYWINRVNRILIIDCFEETQISRTIKRDQAQISYLNKIIKRQASRAQRLAIANDIIFNEGKTISEIFYEVDQLHQYYLTLAKNFL